MKKAVVSFLRNDNFHQETLPPLNIQYEGFLLHLKLSSNAK